MFALTQRFSSANLRGVFYRKYHQSHFTDQEAEALERQDICLYLDRGNCSTALTSQGQPVP